MRLYVILMICYREPHTLAQSMVRAVHSKEEAIGIGYRELKERNPTSEGWIDYKVDVSLVSDEEIVEAGWIRP